MVPLLLLALGLALTAAAPWTDQDQEQLDVGEQRHNFRSMPRDCMYIRSLRVGWWGGGLGTFVNFSSQLHFCI